MHTPAISRGSQNKIQVHINTPLHISFNWRLVMRPRERRKCIRQSGQQNYKAHLIAQHTPEHLSLKLNLAVDIYCTHMPRLSPLVTENLITMVVYNVSRSLCGIIDFQCWFKE